MAVACWQGRRSFPGTRGFFPRLHWSGQHASLAPQGAPQPASALPPLPSLPPSFCCSLCSWSKSGFSGPSDTCLRLRRGLRGSPGLFPVSFSGITIPCQRGWGPLLEQTQCHAWGLPPGPRSPPGSRLPHRPPCLSQSGPQVTGAQPPWTLQLLPGSCCPLAHSQPSLALKTL